MFETKMAVTILKNPLSIKEIKTFVRGTKPQKKVILLELSNK